MLVGRSFSRYVNGMSYVHMKFISSAFCKNLRTVICRGQEDPATWASSYGHTWRTTGDINDTWERFGSNIRKLVDYL